MAVGQQAGDAGDDDLRQAEDLDHPLEDIRDEQRRRRDLVAVDDHSGRAKTYRLTPAGVAVRTDYMEWVTDWAASV